MPPRRRIQSPEIPFDPKDLFQDIVFFLDPSVPIRLSIQLEALLIQTGATLASTPQEPNLNVNRHSDGLQPRFDLDHTTHIITNSLNIPEYRDLGRYQDDMGNVLVVSRNQLSGLHQRDPASRNTIRLDGESDIPSNQVELCDRYISIVTPLWVTQSYDMRRRVPTRSYSPDPYQFFSGVVIAIDSSAGLPEADLEVIEATVIAWGGQFKKGLTADTTHLICTEPSSSEDYQTAMSLKDEMRWKIVLPHWYHQCVVLRTLISEEPFQFPSPPILNPTQPNLSPDYQHGINGYPGSKIPFPRPTSKTPIENSEFHSATRLAFLDQGLSPMPVSVGLSQYLQVYSGDLEYDAEFPNHRNQDEQDHDTSQANQTSGGHKLAQAHPAFKGKMVYLASSLHLKSSTRQHLVERIEQLGARVFDAHVSSPSPDPGQHPDVAEAQRLSVLATKSEEALKRSEYVICESRTGWEFWLSWDLSKTIGTLHWIMSILNALNSSHSAVRSPLDKLLDFPIPPGRPSGWKEPELVSLTNYTGSSRAYLIRLIQKMGLRYAGHLTGETSILVAANQAGLKAQGATKMSIQIVNHIYIEECFQAWERQPYRPVHLDYPDGVNMIELIGQLAHSFDSVTKWTKRPEVIKERKSALAELPSKKCKPQIVASSLRPPLASKPDQRSFSAFDDSLDMLAESDQVMGSLLPASSSPINPEARPESAPSKEDKHSAASSAAPLPSLGDLHVLETVSPARRSSPVPALPIPKRRTKPRLLPETTTSTEDMDLDVLDPQPGPSPDATHTSGPQADPKKLGTCDLEEELECQLARSAPSSPKDKLREPEAMDTLELELELDEPRTKKLKSKKTYGVQKPSERRQSEQRRDVELLPGSSDLSDLDDMCPERQVRTKGSQIAAKAIITTPTRGLSKHQTVPALSDTSVTPSARRTRTETLENEPGPSTTRKSITRNAEPDGAISMQSARHPRRAAQVAKAKVSSAAEDMNVHAKEKKRKRPSGGGLAGVEDGGYWGDVAGPESVSKPRRAPGRTPTVTPKPTSASGSSIAKSNARDMKVEADDDDDEWPSESELFGHYQSKKLEATDVDRKPKLDGLQGRGGSKTAKGKKKVEGSTTGPQGKKKSNRGGRLELATPGAEASVCILETGTRIEPEVILALQKLGATTTEEFGKCTHLLTDEITRNAKFIQALVEGYPIVSHAWAKACTEAGKILDADGYLPQDSIGEAKYGFELRRSVSKAQASKLLVGRVFYISSRIRPDQETIKDLIQRAGGKVLTKKPLVKDIRNQSDTYVISSEEDQAFWKPLMKRAEDEDEIPIYTSGLISQGLLTQNMPYEEDEYRVRVDS